MLVFFNTHCSTMNLVKEKQGGLVPPGPRGVLGGGGGGEGVL